jgi:hypothetical protein
MFQTYEVTSSNIASIQYDAERKVARVQFKDKAGNPTAVWDYKRVSTDVFEEWMASESVGSYFSRNIKGLYESIKVS